ncbi:MAG: DUF6498-containing protein [Parcubacteria group bacterium]
MITPSAIILIVVNFIPLVGVLFFGWSLFAILFLYWLENWVVGLFNVFRMAKAQGTTVRTNTEINNVLANKYSKVTLIPFFILHYGMFTLIHGVFVFAVFGPPDIPFWSMITAGASLFVSHTVSYFSNFIGKGEYKNISPDALFGQPYKRIVIMHLTILAGGFLVKGLGAPIMALVVMIILKTAIDLFSHFKEHEKFQWNVEIGQI